MVVYRCTRAAMRGTHVDEPISNVVQVYTGCATKLVYAVELALDRRSRLQFWWFSVCCVFTILVFFRVICVTPGNGEMARYWMVVIFGVRIACLCVLLNAGSGSTQRFPYDNWYNDRYWQVSDFFYCCLLTNQTPTRHSKDMNRRLDLYGGF